MNVRNARVKPFGMDQEGVWNKLQESDDDENVEQQKQQQLRHQQARANSSIPNKVITL